MRIAALMPEAMANTIYRSLVPMQALAHRGHVVHIEEHDDVRNPELLQQFDLVHFLTFNDFAMRRLARRLRTRGVAVVWDNDYDYASIPKSMPAYLEPGSMARQSMLAATSAMMREANVITTPTEVLAERYRATDGVEVRVLPNYLPPTFKRPERVMPHTGVTIGWVAREGHRGDFEALGLRDALERLLQRHQHVEVIGIGFDLELRSRRYCNQPQWLYGALPERVMHFDIGIAPLLDIPFNQARSDIKVKEYAAMGVPWLASPIGPFAELGEEQGGRLVPDDRWYEELERLVLDADARSRLARRGRQWAEGETIEQHVDRWEAAFEDAVELAGSARATR